MRSLDFPHCILGFYRRNINAENDVRHLLEQRRHKIIAQLLRILRNRHRLGKSVVNLRILGGTTHRIGCNRVAEIVAQFSVVIKAELKAPFLAAAKKVVQHLQSFIVCHRFDCTAQIGKLRQKVALIYTSYLHGDSLQTIKSKVEAGGYKTVRGNTTWSTQALLRILQNEKYCGDVLLQKTFTDNVLTGGPKKNTGQLPQYYIENNHEGIVTKQMYREVQAEIARRNSKSCANRRKQKRGRYNSKYALSERLYCGECGSPYKRVTWNIHGRKEIVWRCVNRVTYGTKFCHNSPSVQEEVLHQTMLRAIQNLADNYTEEVAMQINGILHDLQGGTTELEKLQQKLADSQQEFDRLLDMSLECDASFLDEKLKHASEEIDNLQKQVDQLTASQQKAANPNLQLTDSDFRITEYSDTLVARIIERIEVISAVRIKIEFIGGYTVTVPLQS